MLFMWKYEKAKDLIKDRGRTREWVAKQSRITPEYLNLCLCGQRTPSAAVLALMALALDCDESELVDKSPEEPTEAAG